MRVAPLAFCLLAASCAAPAEGEGEGDHETPTTLSALKEQIFQPRCSASGCHGSVSPALGLNLVTDPAAALVGVASATNPAIQRVVAGDADASLLYQILQTSVGTTEQMPPGFVLPARDVDLVRSWIAAGALSQ